MSTSISKYFGRIRSSSHASPQDVHPGRVPPPYTNHAEFVPTSEEHSRRPPKIYAIAVMGATGSGKSTLISKLTGQRIEIGHGLSSCTQVIKEVPCKIGDKDVILVDTPGFSDTTRSDTEILNILVDWMKESHGDVQLSGIIYLHSIQDVRMYGSSLQNLRMFRRLCGDKNLGNVILATTKWEITPESDAMSREKELCSNDEFWGLMIAAGCVVQRCMDRKTCAEFLTEEILRIGEESIIPQIQHEVVELGKPIIETEAGAYINEDLIKQAKKHEEDLKAVKEEYNLALKEHDRGMQEALENRERNILRLIAQKAEEKRILHLDELNRLRERVDDLEKSTSGEHINRRKLWRSSWKCLICKTKTDVKGSWICQCGLKQRNSERHVDPTEPLFHT